MTTLAMALRLYGSSAAVIRVSRAPGNIRGPLTGSKLPRVSHSRSITTHATPSEDTPEPTRHRAGKTSNLLWNVFMQLLCMQCSFDFGSIRGMELCKERLNRLNKPNQYRWVPRHEAQTSAGTLSHPETQQLAFSALALIYTGVAAATILAPVWSLVHLLKVSGVVLTAENILVASAAAKGMLVVAGAYGWLVVACLMCLKV